EPLEGIDPIRVGAHPNRLFILVHQAAKAGHGAAMLEIAQAPQRQDEYQRENRAATATRMATPAATGDFFAYQASEGGRDESYQERSQHQRLHDEHDVPRVPPAIK